MAFIRRVRTGSGATAVQIAEYAGGRQRIVEHVGSAHTEAELGVLLARACELLEDPAQGALDLAVEPSVPVASILAAPADAALFDPLLTDASVEDEGVAQGDDDEGLNVTDGEHVDVRLGWPVVIVSPA